MTPKEETPDDGINTLPVGEERLTVEKRARVNARVRIRTEVDEREEWVRETIEQERVSVERIPVNRQVADRPQIRQEGDVLIVPLVEEIVVTEKRLVLREELRITKTVSTNDVAEPVCLRRVTASVEQVPSDS